MSELKQVCSKGQALVEFSLVSFMLCIVFLAVVEMARMILVSTAVANAARAGARYAIVHGSSRAVGNCTTCASGTGSLSQVTTVIDNLAVAGALTIGKLVVTVTYPGSSNAPGQLVSVTVAYPYNPLTSYLPLSVWLGSTTEGVIEF